MMSDQATKERKLTGRHVLIILILSFGIVFAVNFYFVYLAVKSYPGEDVKNPYVQGIAYNSTLAERAAQEELGWSAQIGLEGMAGERVVRVRLMDKDGEGLAYLTLHAEMRRTISDKEDIDLIFRPVGGGDYVADLGALAPGKWELRLEVFDKEEEAPVFQALKILDAR